MRGCPGPRLTRRLLALVSSALLVLALVVAGARAATPTPPPNDNRDNAASLGALPATTSGTTVGATVEPYEPRSDCGANGPSVWYELSVGATVPSHIAVQMLAGGDLDAIVDVYVRQRSQDIPVRCGATDRKGEAIFQFTPTRQTTYLIRVAQLVDSAAGRFSLRVFVPPPPPRAPGAALVPDGVGSALERVVNASVAYAVHLDAGQTYRVNLTSPDTGCMSLSVYGPDPTSFDGVAAAPARCQGYRLFTPTRSGTYSLLVRASGSDIGQQRYHLELASATAAQTTPGLPLNNDITARAALQGNRINVARLYHFDVTGRSTLTLDLRDAGHPFDLELLSADGRQLQCTCGDTGDQTLNAVTGPGRYYALVSAREFSSGAFSLQRRSRVITSAAVLVDHARYVQLLPLAAASVEVVVRPAVTGTATVEIDRFDPVFGWQFHSEQSVHVVDGEGQLTFTPPSVGQWLFHADYLGTLTSSPSQSRFSRVLSAGPLTQ